MLKSAQLAHNRNHSHTYESNTPPPYIQSPDDLYSRQDNDTTTGRSMGKELDLAQDYDDDLLAQVHQINDADLLKQLLIEKEQERQGLASNLDLAARLGLDLHQQIQRLELESTVQIQSLQDEKNALQSKANLSQELQYQLSSSEHEIRELTGHNRFLQRELDTCRQELKTFRKELDELSEHMAEISTEMFDAKSKVNSYARRLGEVEQELASTQELNVNLQIQLDNALQKQKQTHSNTTQAVKLIQSDLGKVFSDSDTMRMTLEELETRQMKCEGKVIEMMTNTREYAQLLEEAQETIHTLRIESDMEGRGWSSRGPHAAIWDNKTGEHPEQHMRDLEAARTRAPRRLPSASDILGQASGESYVAEGLDPRFDTTSWGTAGANSLGMELGMGSGLDRELSGYAQELAEELSGAYRGLDQELEGGRRGLDEELAGTGHRALDQELSGFSRGLNREISEYDHEATLNQELADAHQAFSSSNHGTLANELAAAVEDRSRAEDMQEHAVSTFVTDKDRHSLPTGADGDDHDSLPTLPQRFSLSAELHQRLEENNILQNVLSARPSWANSSTIGISTVLSPIQHSPSSVRDIGRTLSMMTLAHQKASSSTSSMNSMMSPKASPLFPNNSAESDTATSSSPSTTIGFVPSVPNQSTLSGMGMDIANTSSSTIASPGARRAALDTQNILGLKYLLSAASSADLSNVITKTNAKAPTASSPNNLSKDSRPRSSNASAGKNGRSTTPSGTKNTTHTSSRDSKTRTSSISSSVSSGASASKRSANASIGRMTPSRPIPIVGTSSGRSGHKSTSPASSWSSSTSGLPMASMARRPSLPPVPSSASSSSTTNGALGTKPRPPWN